MEAIRRFPTRPQGESRLAGQILQWAHDHGWSSPRFDARIDSYRWALDVARESGAVDPRGERWPLFAAHIVAEFLQDVTGEEICQRGRKALRRLITQAGATVTLTLVADAAIRVIEADGDRTFGESITAYAAAVWRRQRADAGR
ncbi:hypothetical protein ER308_07305 [Egibacter rhizosphaerae]|uniref:Uncharacterized protein n=1 Tax=Egibacter rhizosphaerae TaxID=1670831 RepID=A0A411YE00_9ACTN|nr:hypothetical protein [Egibacter rhizosphaerae]QBI19372.1 hypothetical protein ER308_07305 [Egibacter rhizosphaerae]